MIVYLLRHGKTTANLEHRLAGQSHAELLPESYGICRQIGQELNNIRFDAFFCSPQERARQSFAALQLKKAPEPVFDDRLMELNVGVYESKKIDELPKDLLQQLADNPLQTQPPGGESYAQVKIRVLNFLDEIQKNYRRKVVAILSHWGPSAIIAAALLQLKTDEWGRWQHPNERVYKIENSKCSYFSPGQPWREGFTLRDGAGFGPFSFSSATSK